MGMNMKTYMRVDWLVLRKYCLCRNHIPYVLCTLITFIWAKESFLLYVPIPVLPMSLWVIHNDKPYICAYIHCWCQVDKHGSGIELVWLLPAHMFDPCYIHIYSTKISHLSILESELINQPSNTFQRWLARPTLPTLTLAPGLSLSSRHPNSSSPKLNSSSAHIIVITMIIISSVR